MNLPFCIFAKKQQQQQKKESLTQSKKKNANKIKYSHFESRKGLTGL